MKTWQLQDAKARLSELVQQAINFGPQGISLRGMLEVVLISKNDYIKLTGQNQNFIHLMKKSPLRGLNLDVKRDKSRFRDIEL